MRVTSHIIASISLGGVLYIITKSFFAGVLCVLIGVLIDFDHIIEYGMHHGLRNATYAKIVRACEATPRANSKEGFKKLYLVFHLSEAALLFWAVFFFTKNIYMLAIASGYTLHLIMDCIGNKTRLVSYSIIWRARNNFSVERFFRKEKA